MVIVVIRARMSHWNKPDLIKKLGGVEQKWPRTLRSIDKPSITAGSDADEAWAPVSKERGQTARHRHAGRGEA